MSETIRRKLIEVALPLEAINRESAREKSIRHGHPSTLHLGWARLAQPRQPGDHSAPGGHCGGHLRHRARGACHLPGRLPGRAGSGDRRERPGAPVLHLGVRGPIADVS